METMRHLTCSNEQPSSIKFGTRQGSYLLLSSFKGIFPSSFMPTQENLALKIGAQIMTVINDPGTVPSDDGVDQYTSKKFFNGSIGTILELHEDHIVISTEFYEYIAVYRTTWTNISYRWHPERKTIESEEIGAFTQIPVRLAWAITVHKSQGLTFDKVIADINDAFTNGQAYVALSRCKNLNSLHLQRELKVSDALVDPDIVDFHQLNLGN